MISRISDAEAGRRQMKSTADKMMRSRSPWSSAERESDPQLGVSGREWTLKRPDTGEGCADRTKLLVIPSQTVGLE